MSKKTIKDIDLKGKKVLVRCDFNVPMDEERNITDNTRIVAALPTIKYLLENNCAIILCSPQTNATRPGSDRNGLCTSRILPDGPWRTGPVLT